MQLHISTQGKHNSSRIWQQIFSLFTLFFLLAAAPLGAQDVLMGLTSDGGPEGKGTAYSIKTDGKSFTVIKGFVDWGTVPVSDLVRGTDGYLYGMTPFGGTYNYGTIFRFTPATGDIVILRHLNGGIDGGYPKGSLIQATDGNFYGTASSGSLNNGGCIFKITPSGQYNVIRSLTLADGTRPQGRLVQASDGHLYGINNSGGTAGYGTIFKLTLGGVYSVLKSFNGTTEGGSSYGSLTQGSDGALYGMTRYGGTNKFGVIFRIMPGTNAYSVIRHLNGTTDGWYPMGDLVLYKDGFLYGMTPGSGTNGNGTVFKINSDGTRFSVLMAMSASTYGGSPQGSLLLASDNNFYGMAYHMSGGFAGSIFRMTPGGSFSLVKKFTEAVDGGNPNGTLIEAPNGTVYGMTQYGGKFGKGTMFRINLSGAGYSALIHFNGATQGNVPQDNLALGKDSAYYGVTQMGGTYNHGTIFKICGGVTTTLRSFNRNTDGGYPTGGLVRGKDGNLYGMTEDGGTNGRGTIYRISPTGSFAVLRHLNGTTDGHYPKGTLAINTLTATDSSLYGMTSGGGTGNSGTIFKITPKGAFTVLRPLVNATDGSAAEGGLVMNTDGFFYGLTNTRFFKIKPTGADFAMLHTFAYSTVGSNPAGSLIRGTDGAFYGTMTFGGINGKGTAFRITTLGSVTVLRSFAGADGANPKSSLVQGSDGAFYGTTSYGGTNNLGTIFRVTAAKAFLVLKHFNMDTDGGIPLGGLILAPKIVLVANPQSTTTTEDVAKAITLTGSGPANMTYNILIKPRRGTVSSGTVAARTYTPAANFYGVDSFAFTTNLGCLSSSPAWVKITVTPVNDTPKLAPIGTLTVVKGKLLNFIATAKDPDPGQTKTFSLIGAPAGATINASTGLFAWTPNVTGTFTFKVRVTDNGSPILYSEQSVTVTVTATTLMVTTTTANDLTANKAAEEKTGAASLFPNPVVSSFTVRLEKQATDVNVRIADAKGAVVHQKQYNGVAHQLQINVATLKPGAYIVTLETKNGMQLSLPFVKQ